MMPRISKPSTYAEMILKHVLDKHKGEAEAVNTIYEEIAERINAEGTKRAREVCEAVINGDLIIFWNIFAIVFFLLLIIYPCLFITPRLL
jgi:hypothetical protein